MASDSDDLEHQLQENLKLRRELAAEVAKANQGGGIAFYWICLALAAGLAILFVLWAIFWN
jgi:hypothetical protein